MPAEKLCSFCLSPDKPTSVINELELAETVLFVCDLIEDNFPLIICVNCELKLEHFRAFKTTAQSSFNYLKGFYNRNNSTISDVVEELKPLLEISFVETLNNVIEEQGDEVPKRIVKTKRVVKKLPQKKKNNQTQFTYPVGIPIKSLDELDEFEESLKSRKVLNNVKEFVNDIIQKSKSESNHMKMLDLLSEMFELDLLKTMNARNFKGTTNLIERKITKLLFYDLFANQTKHVVRMALVRAHSRYRMRIFHDKRRKLKASAKSS